MLLHINERLSCWRLVTELLATEQEEFWSGSSCSDGALVRSEVIFHPTSSPTQPQRRVYCCIWSMLRHESSISAASAPLLPCAALLCSRRYAQVREGNREDRETYFEAFAKHKRVLKRPNCVRSCCSRCVLDCTCMLWEKWHNQGVKRRSCQVKPRQKQEVTDGRAHSR